MASTDELPLCRDAPWAPPQQAFDDPTQGCRVDVGNWETVRESARANLGFGFGPECSDEDLERCARDCAAEEVDACIGLLNARLRGASVELTDAMRWIALACTREDANACHALGNIWHAGLAGVEPDRTRAFSVRETACRLDQGAACSMLGHMYRNGGDGIEQDAQLGFQLVRRGCQLGDPVACNDFGWSMVGDTWARPHDPDRALPLFVYSCARGVAHGCGSLGEALENGWGVPIDREWALTFWSLQCQHHGHPEACAAVERLEE